ncbi:acyl-CoA dehydrogenase family protein [Sphingobium sp. Sx8-8]|uniref:acyl-CoA dehydrogenase family protein n=1 Tax=Sphingobium sp. Sx8-8 TaxID=2933617 RepID=UPI001F593A2C|nr:acyl-CoA dehydrogenase family protein [Sphingobium sp. Sx8-8]
MFAIDDILDPLNKLLADNCSPAVVREVEAGGSADGLWHMLVDSGFLDALVPEEQGGAGLALSNISPLLELAGRYVLPLPFSETMVARALLARASIERPEGPIILVTAQSAAGEGILARAVPYGTVAQWALVDQGETISLLSVAAAKSDPTGGHHSLSSDLFWRGGTEPVATFACPSAGLWSMAATLRACEIAGMVEAVLDMTVRYSGERSQFGKTISKLQAIQQQLAVAAEQVLMAQMGAAIGCSGGLDGSLTLAAIGKHAASISASVVAATAHAVHGAMGMSAEYDLQLYTRRLYEWRFANGSESYWSGLIGQERVAAGGMTTVDFLKDHAAAMEKMA